MRPSAQHGLQRDAQHGLQRDADEFAAVLVYEAKLKAMAYQFLVGHTFYRWCIQLSQQRRARSDRLVAAACADKVWVQCIQASWDRWVDHAASHRALSRWITAAKSRRATRAQIACHTQWILRCNLIRTTLHARALLREWRVAVMRQCVLTPAMTRWASRASELPKRAANLRQLRRWASPIRRRLQLISCLQAWARWLQWRMLDQAAVVRGDICELEHGFMHWRRWATALRAWRHLARQLELRSRPYRDALTGRPLAPSMRARSWQQGAALRWSVASSGFAAEVRHKAAQGPLSLAHSDLDWQPKGVGPGASNYLDGGIPQSYIDMMRVVGDENNALWGWVQRPSIYGMCNLSNFPRPFSRVPQVRLDLEPC
jgi:hypothetical protein